MEPMWPLYLNDDDHAPALHCPSETAFDLAAAIVTLCRRFRGALSAATGGTAISEGTPIRVGHMPDTPSAQTG